MFHRAVGFFVFWLLLPASLLAIDIDGEVRVGLRSGLAKPARVQLLREHQVVYEQFTGLDGRFEFHSVEPASYLVRAIYDNLPQTDVVVNVAGGNTRYRVPITIKPPKDGPVGKTQVVSVDQLLIPKDARKEYEEGLKDRKAGDCTKAATHLQKAVTKAPKFGEAFNELGICLKSQNDLAGSENAFKKAIELNATIYPSINLADLYAGQKRFAEARRIVDAARQKNPGEGDLLFALARIEFDQGHLKEAEAAGLEAHSRIHRTADVHLLLAKVYLASKNTPAVVGQMQAYLAENPNGPMADVVRKNLKGLVRE